MTRYELIERIGSGGMAEIFKGKAIAAGGFEKPVAIKRILPHLSQDKRFVELLIAEANILSFLRHRNIVQIFDVGLGADDQYFLVMEYVDGLDLGRLQSGLKRHNKRLPLDLALHIACEVCEALEQAHIATGPDGKPMRLVHRDVSPSNVLLSRSGEVKLTDFGIAKRREEVTGHGTVRGKFAYISPEQAINGHVDARSDVFSVGIVLHELLLGRPLYSELADYEALTAVREARAPRIRQLDPALDPRLDELVATALAPSPDARYQSAGELGKALREVRYALPETNRDPAHELAGLVQRFAGRSDPSHARRRDDSVEEKTVVRLNSAPGFSRNDDFDESRHKSYADARQILNLFEEEVTRSVDSSRLGQMRSAMRTGESSVDSTMDRSISGVLQSADGGEEATMVVSGVSLLGSRPAALAEERPTKMLVRSAPEGRDLGQPGPFLSDDLFESAPLPATSGAVNEAMDEPTLQATLDSLSSRQRVLPDISSFDSDVFSSLAAEPTGMPPGTYAPARGPDSSSKRRRKWLALGLGIVATGLVSFAIAAVALDRGEASSKVTGKVAVVDAGPPLHDAEPRDTALPDAAPPPEDADAVETNSETEDEIKKPIKKRSPKKRKRNTKKKKKKTTGGKTTGGKATGGKTTGGKATGGKTTGGKTTGGKTTGGKTTGGKTTGGKTGKTTGGKTTGGKTTGGKTTTGKTTTGKTTTTTKRSTK